MNKIASMVVALVLIVASGCNSQVSSIPPISDGKKTYDQFISSKSFPYTIAREKKIKIEQKYNNLKLGMTKKDVTSILGEPDFSTYMQAKESDRFIGSAWAYYFYKPTADLVNEKLDKGVFIYFGATDKAEWIVPKNIEGLAEKGGPRRSNR